MRVVGAQTGPRLANDLANLVGLRPAPRPLTMGWCVDCHRQQNATQGPGAARLRRLPPLVMGGSGRPHAPHRSGAPAQSGAPLDSGHRGGLRVAPHAPYRRWARRGRARSIRGVGSGRPYGAAWARSTLRCGAGLRAPPMSPIARAAPASSGARLDCVAAVAGFGSPPQLPSALRHASARAGALLDSTVLPGVGVFWGERRGLQVVQPGRGREGPREPRFDAPSDRGSAAACRRRRSTGAGAPSGTKERALVVSLNEALSAWATPWCPCRLGHRDAAARCPARARASMTLSLDGIRVARSVPGAGRPLLRRPARRHGRRRHQGRGHRGRRRVAHVAAAQGRRVRGFLVNNRNKRGIAVDLKAPRAWRCIKRLVRGADVLVENFRTGTMEQFGLGYETLSAINPRLVYCSVSAFGRTGPRATRGRLRGPDAGLQRHHVDHRRAGRRRPSAAASRSWTSRRASSAPSAS